MEGSITTKKITEVLRGEFELSDELEVKYIWFNLLFIYLSSHIENFEESCAQQRGNYFWRFYQVF